MVLVIMIGIGHVPSELTNVGDIIGLLAIIRLKYVVKIATIPTFWLFIL